MDYANNYLIHLGRGIMKTYWLRWKGQSIDLSTSYETDGCNMLPSHKTPPLSYENVRRSTVTFTPEMDIRSARSYKSFVDSAVHTDRELNQKYEIPTKIRFGNSKEKHFMKPTKTADVRPKSSQIHVTIPSTANSRTCCIL
ncbi:hypothetical protein LOTGIDRAFT_163222 [Lottia gigantea]|uniref:Uncharacterized protein n=1 Tax=Lottia gigantea TaxID=225164 RepID=V4AEW7_LOTGI|nr:hypothetical protein LOTGIDRAFT_163222 [Lottia gigantea]ESO91861.1 hypothetical protein LOTGIDRAFT_163222 [Lottia gigantea]